MRYLALASDYDGTLATHGTVSESTLDAVDQLRRSGRKFLLVTGRRLEELLEVFPAVEICDMVVAENGALLYNPATGKECRLAPEPPAGFVEELRRRGVDRVDRGRSIVATWEPYEKIVLEVIRDFAIEWQIIFNKGAVMILPTGVNKALGLRAALKELGLSAHNTVGIGDAENDEAFLRECECGVAVANALDSLKDRADLVTERTHGDGAVEVIQRLIATDLEELALAHLGTPLGPAPGGGEFLLPAYGGEVLVAGQSGGGKSKLVAAIVERLADRKYQFCILDPVGDYQTLVDAAVLGTSQRTPTVDEITVLLEDPEQNAVVSLFATPRDERPRFFEQFLAATVQLRARTGRPHWIIVDEAHYFAPGDWPLAEHLLPEHLGNVMLVTAFPERLAQPMIAQSEWIIGTGDSPGEAIAGCAELLGEPPPRFAAPGDSANLAWRRTTGEVRVFTAAEPSGRRQRHAHDAVAGDLDAENSFFFRGPDERLNLRASNLRLFIHLAEGIDDATWLHHLRRHDYSSWIRKAIKNELLAGRVEAIEGNSDFTPQESRRAIRDEIQQQYLDLALSR